jgi:hypothetical protein
MKIRGSIYRVWLYVAVALLVCSGLSVAAFRIARGSSHKNMSIHSASMASGGSSRATSPGNQAKWLQAYGQLPLSFMENQGQTAQEVRYVSHGSQYDLFLTPTEAVVALRHIIRHYDMSPRHRAKSIKAMIADRKAGTTTTALRMQFQGANPNPQIAGADGLPGKVNYYIGNDPKKWHKNIPTYAQVKYKDMYPGVDLVFYGNQRKLEYDFIVAPGADPNVIRMNLTGARKMRLDAHGNVVLTVQGGDVQLQKPLVYQSINGQRREIAGKYSLRGAQVSFAVASYDRREPLIVDPILNYSTYLGGSSDETGYAIATDSSGDAYIGGATDSTDFPTAGAGTVTSNAGGITVGFVSELNPTGTALLESAYIGGTGDGDQIYGLAVDSSSNVYATGLTVSTDFPTTAANAFKPTLSSNANGTSFLVESNSSGSVFYSTYLGGTGGDYGNAVAADATGNAYVTGLTTSAPGAADVDFPVTAGAYQSTLPNASGSAFLTRINTTLSGAASLIYSSYLGGDGANASTAALQFGDSGFGIAVDTANKAYLAGTTTSSDFPTSAGAFQPTANVANLWGEAFVSEIDTTMSGPASLVYPTYLGGSGTVSSSPPPGGFGDFANALDLQAGTTVAYVTGVTNSADFPTTAGAYQLVGDPVSGAAFVTLVDTSVASALKYSTYLGSGFTTGAAIKAAATTGNAYIGGATASTTFPVTPGAYQTSLAASANADGIIAEIHPAGAGAADLVYATYFGGSGTAGNPDQIFGLALGTLPNVLVTGQTFSPTNLPATTGAFQTALHGNSDAFAASLNLTAPSLVVTPSSLTFTATAENVATAAQTVTLTNSSNSVIAFTGTAILNPSPAAAATDFAVTGTTCTAGVPALGTCTISVDFTASATSESATLSIIDSDSSSPQSVALTGTAPAPFSVSPTSLSFNSPAVGTATAAQSVTLTNNTSAAVVYTSSVVTLTSAMGAAADFALTPATTCGATIAANGGTCTVSVTYTPSVTATETATLTITDGAGVQTVALTGTVTAVAPDFSLSAAPTSLTVKKGASGTSTITVTSIGSFNAAVALTCTGDPRKSTCAIAPASVTPTAGGTATATLTLTTKSLVAPPPSSPRYLPPVSIRVVVPATFAALLMLLMFLSERRFRTRLGLAAATMIFVALAGCGTSGTPKGTSTLTVTGTSGSTTHTVTIALTVD